MRHNSEQCEICKKIVGIRESDSRIITPFIMVPIVQWESLDGCDHSKNGYCGVFRAQATLDKIEFNMHDRSEPKEM